MELFLSSSAEPFSGRTGSPGVMTSAEVVLVSLDADAAVVLLTVESAIADSFETSFETESPSEILVLFGDLEVAFVVVAAFVRMLGVVGVEALVLWIADEGTVVSGVGFDSFLVIFGLTGVDVVDVLVLAFNSVVTFSIFLTSSFKTITDILSKKKNTVQSRNRIFLNLCIDFP